MLERLMQRARAGNMRTLRHPACHLSDFASNDYLGLARDPALKQAVRDAWENEGTPLGSTGSRLLTGNSPYAEHLEADLAAFHGFEAGLLFSCGYMANIGLVAAVARSSDVILYDTHVHASAYDGMQLCRATCYPFRHNDPDHLEKRLQRTTGRRFILIASVYSTDGSLAPLEAMAELACRYGAHLIVDEAHAVGIFGTHGEGLVAAKGLTSSLFAQVTTFGKAVGAFGAIVLGSSVLRQHLVNFSRPFVYSTAPPLSCLVAIRCAYDALKVKDAERRHLQRLIRRFTSVYPDNHATPLQPIYVGENLPTRALARYLAECGFDARAILSPTVAKGKECIRVSLHAFNSEEETAELLDHLIAYDEHNCGRLRHRCG